MATKTLKKKVNKKPAKSSFASPVVDSAKDILYAGLGTIKVTREESSKLYGRGNKLFDKLVSEGTKFEKKSLKQAESTIEDFRKDVESRVDSVRKQAVDNLDDLGNKFDTRVEEVLDRLGISSSKKLEDLSGRVKNVSSQVNKNWKEFENSFEKRVKAVLENLHVPVMGDLNKLSEGIQTVSRDAAENLANLEKHVSGLLFDHESSATEELKKLKSDILGLSGQLSSNWEKLEGIIEKQVTKILRQLRIASKEDTQKLAAELRVLTRKVNALDKKLAKLKTATPRKAPARKAATKTTEA